MHFWIAFQAFLFAVLIPLATHLLKAFGIGAVSYFGLTIITDQLKAYLLTQISGLPSDVVGIMGIMNLDVGFNMILSAVIARAILKGFSSSSGSIKKYTLNA